MGKIVLRAKVKTAKMVNEGYIIIDGEKKDGIFGHDYIQIDSDDDCIYLTYYEYKYDLSEKKPKFFFTTKHYINASAYSTELCCPEKYSFFCQEEELVLTLICKEKDQNQIRKAVRHLDKAKNLVFQ